jgi:hypothetical protein
LVCSDQIPIPYSYYSSKTLETKGTKTIHVCASTTENNQVKFITSVDATRKMLPPIHFLRELQMATLKSMNSAHTLGTAALLSRMHGWTMR